MNQRLWISLPLFVLCIAGAAISKLLLDKHLFKSAGPSWFAAVCGDEPETSQPADDISGEAGHAAPTHGRGEGGRDCAAVLASRWATLPPRGEAEDPLAEAAAPRLQVPVAYLGMVYFITLAIWFLFIGRVSPDKPQWFRLPLIFVLGGVAFSIFYLVLMFTGMDEWCPWCLATHVINFVVLGGMLLLRPRDRGTVGPSDQVVPEPDHLSPLAVPPLTKGGQGGDTHPSHPSGRLVAVCLLLAVAVGSALWNWYIVGVVLGQKNEVAERLAKFEGDAQFLTTLYYSKPEVQITIRDDDPQTSRDENYCKLVIFSDFQCPWCRSFATLIDRKLKGLFNNHLRVVWKHYPLSKECNPHVSTDRHAEACRAARAAEAARLQGGNDSFWKAHDRIFAAQERLKDLDYPAMAKDLGLDPDRFMRDMESEDVAQRIAEDADQAKSLGVKSTPAIFLLDRPVDPSLAKVGAFWLQMSHSFNYAYDEKVYPEKLKKLAEQGKAPPPTTQHDDHGH